MRRVINMKVLKILQVHEFNLELTKHIEDGWQPVDGIVKMESVGIQTLYSTVLVQYADQ